MANRAASLCRSIFLVAVVGSCALACDDSRLPPPGGTGLEEDPLAAEPDCDPPCESGCCLGGSCLAGNTRAYCGRGGELCRSCALGSFCDEGQCAASDCDEESCGSGCCDNEGRCLNGTQDSACGSDALSCQLCDVDEACIDQLCVPDASNFIRVEIVSGSLQGSPLLVCLELNCDLYLAFHVGESRVESSIVEQSNEPVWNETVLSLSEEALLEGFDIDVLEADPIIGGRVISSCAVQPDADDLQAGEQRFLCGKLEILLAYN